jgi:hypothetical protein
VSRFLFLLWGVTLLLSTPPVEAQTRPSPLINGIFTSQIGVLNERSYPDGGGLFSQGWSNLANLRYKAVVNEGLSFSVSANISAESGFYAQSQAAGVGIELERLFFKAGSEWLEVEAGLLRIPRGYGYVFSPMDLFNVRDPTNSLDPQARPAGKWGVHATFFAGDMWKIELFGLAPDDLLEKGPWGSKLGAASTFSLGKVNVDTLSSVFLPSLEYGVDPASRSLPPYTNNDFTEVAGFAVKADVEIGLYVEAVYRIENRSFAEGSYYGKDLAWYRGLEAVLGADYTITDLYLMAEYLFYGPGHVDWGESLDALYTSPDWKNLSPAGRPALLDLSMNPLAFAHHDYLFLMSRYSPAQDLSVGVSCLAGLDDLSALFTVFGEYEVVQGLTLQASALFPVDRTLFDSSAAPGEWGSTNLGFHQMFGLAAKVKF